MGNYGETINIDSPLFRRLSDDAAILAQALNMRLDTEKGTYWDDPDYGLSVSNYENAGLTSESLAYVASAIKSECEKDERVSSAAVDPGLEIIEGGYALRPKIKIFPVTGDAFSFVGPLMNFTGASLRRAV
ncbi:MAG: hypothetical protein U0441_14930 [Polyangiaceae bacterium]